MNKLKIVLVAGALTATAAAAPLVSAGGQHHNNPCSVRGIAGKWLFATDIGHFAGTATIPRGDITAAGTMNIDARGNVSGTFDAVIQEVAFLPGETYSGSVQVNDNCTGTLHFVTSRGTERRDTILILRDGKEIRAMSQDPQNLWTYTARRAPQSRR